MAAREAGWDPNDWAKSIQPSLVDVLAEIMLATGLSISTASGVRTGKRVPHPRHWSTLAEVARVQRSK
jgi:hypothetical protein